MKYFIIVGLLAFPFLAVAQQPRNEVNSQPFPQQTKITKPERKVVNTQSFPGQKQMASPRQQSSLNTQPFPRQEQTPSKTQGNTNIRHVESPQANESTSTKYPAKQAHLTSEFNVASPTTVSKKSTMVQPSKERAALSSSQKFKK